MVKGIDISTFNTVTDWAKVNTQVDFIILRAGYGKGNVDQKFVPHADACKAFDIPIGLYWFSYAYTAEMARAEALYCIQQAQKYDITYPIAFDFEYDSVTYASKNGVSITKELVMEMTLAFCKEIAAAGYTASVYTNKDYANRFFDLETLKQAGYDIWYAYYNKTIDRTDISMWQYSSTGTVEGIVGNVDMNYSYKTFPAEKTGWIQEKNGKWWYCHSDGSYTKNDWEQIDGKWYFFDSSGWMQTGWVIWNNKWYYCLDNGDMAENCILTIQSESYGAETYAFGTDGHMLVSTARGALI